MFLFCQRPSRGPGERCKRLENVFLEILPTLPPNPHLNPWHRCKHYRMVILSANRDTLFLGDMWNWDITSKSCQYIVKCNNFALKKQTKMSAMYDISSIK